MEPKLTWAAAGLVAALAIALIASAPARAVDPQMSDVCGRANLSAKEQRACASSYATPAGARGPALALSPETSCENAKLRAAGAYAECLARAASAANAVGGKLDDAATERCDARFDQAFERAEANGGCRTAGGPATLRGPIRGQMEETLAAVKSGPGCWERPYTSFGVYVCYINAYNGGGARSAIDLAAMANQINSYFGAGSVTDDTAVWIEAYGADGAHGATNNGGQGGQGGFAQTTTTINDLRKFFGTSEIYYYLGKKGSNSGSGYGGGGGTGTIVTVNDLTREEPSLGTTVVLAGGGGGGGAGSVGGVCKFKEVYGAAGGGGGEAISTVATAAFGAGAKGGARRNQNYSGSGGGGTISGTGGAINGKGNASVGDDGFAALGGRGGNQEGPHGGFTNQSGVQITLSGGHGGEPGYSAGGGGGGGGYGGGGGGAQGIGDTDCVAGGGGGGGSMARASAVSCPHSRSSFPPSPGILILFDRGSCG